MTLDTGVFRSSCRPKRQGIPTVGQSHQHWLSFIVCGCLALAVWGVFGQTLRYGFINYDDNVYVYDNPAITQGVSLHGLAWIFTHVNGPGEWLPLTALSRMLDCQFYGLHPGGHHLTNVLLHRDRHPSVPVLRNMTGEFWRGRLRGRVFAIHPLRVESVAWVTERKDVLSGLFFMLTLLFYAQAVTSDKWLVTGTQTEATPAFAPPRVTCHRSDDYWLAVIFFALGLMSKPMVVTLPFVLLLVDYWPLGRMTGGAWQTTGNQSRRKNQPSVF